MSRPIGTAKLLTPQIAFKPWRSEPYRLILEIDEQPGAIKFSPSVMSRLISGDPKPIEWRLEREFNYKFEIQSPQILAKEWEERRRDIEVIR